MELQPPPRSHSYVSPLPSPPSGPVWENVKADAMTRTESAIAGAVDVWEKLRTRPAGMVLGTV